MRPSAVRLSIVAALAALGVIAWTSHLVRVGPGGAPRPLALLAESERHPLACDVVLPVAPVGMHRVHSGGTPLLIHYWAPWERNGRAQAAALDSLARLLAPEHLRVVLVCSDPFPSVARFVQRQRLRVRVLLDGPGHLREQVPRPSIPHTVVIGGDGRLAVSQSGEVDWLSPETRAALERVIAESPAAEPDPHPAPSPAPRVRSTS